MKFKCKTVPEFMSYARQTVSPAVSYYASHFTDGTELCKVKRDAVAAKVFDRGYSRRPTSTAARYCSRLFLTTSRHLRFQVACILTLSLSSLVFVWLRRCLVPDSTLWQPHKRMMRPRAARWSPAPKHGKVT